MVAGVFDDHVIPDLDFARVERAAYVKFREDRVENRFAAFRCAISMRIGTWAMRRFQPPARGFATGTAN
jgi:hypothetical protein